MSHTHELPEGFQLFGKMQGQVADQPLVSSEQFSVGGLDTVRGYLESEALGDNGIVGNARTAQSQIGDLLQKQMQDETAQGQPRQVHRVQRLALLRVCRCRHGHGSYEPLAEQQSKFDLRSYGVGTRLKMFNYLNGMLLRRHAAGQPSILEVANIQRVNFRIWGEF